MITNFDSRRYLTLEISADEPGQIFEVPIHFHEDLKPEDYEDLRRVLFRDPSKWGEILQKFIPDWRKEPFRYTTEIRRVKYEMLTHTAFYSQFYAKFPVVDDGGLLEFVSARS